MIVQGRVTAFAIASVSLWAASASRYSSRNFMVRLLDLVELIHAVEKFKNAPRLVFVDARQREADVNQHIFPEFDFGNVLQTNSLEHAAKINLAHEYVVFAISLDDLARNSQAHERFLQGSDDF